MSTHESQQYEAKPAPDAIDLLADHGKPVWALFEEFERIKDGADAQRKKDLVATICREIGDRAGGAK